MNSTNLNQELNHIKCDDFYQNAVMVLLGEKDYIKS
jgi:hypothetical protein